MARADAVLNGAPAAVDPALERDADLAAGGRLEGQIGGKMGSQIKSLPHPFSSLPPQMGPVVQGKETGVLGDGMEINGYQGAALPLVRPVVQRKGAVTLADMLAINGCSVEGLPPEVREVIRRYDALPIGSNEFNVQLGCLLYADSVIEAMGAGDLEVVQKIIQSEIAVVKKQRGKSDPQNREYSGVYDREYGALQEMRRRIRALDYKSQIEGSFPNPWAEPAIRVKKQVESYEGQLEKLKRGAPAGIEPKRMEDPYRAMDTGAEWNKQPYARFLIGEEDKIAQLSQANFQSIQGAELAQGEVRRPFSRIPGYREFCERISALLLEGTMLSHYSFHPQIPMLLSKDYAEASQISLSADNSSLGKERSLKNTGFVFFFLEQKDRPPRESARFGTVRYTLPTAYAAERGILSRSWVMLADFQNAYTGFAKGAVISQDGSGGGGNKTMTFSKANSLEGVMTYQPSGITLQFEPFHNILKGDQIIPGLALFAAQQLYALYNTAGDMGKTFADVGLLSLGDHEILKMVLKLFRLQVMVPTGVVPLGRDMPEELMKPG